eukprot:474309-Prymnesium_polylepis.1
MHQRTVRVGQSDSGTQNRIPTQGSRTSHDPPARHPPKHETRALPPCGKLLVPTFTAGPTQAPCSV